MVIFAKAATPGCRAKRGRIADNSISKGKGKKNPGCAENYKGEKKNYKARKIFFRPCNFFFRRGSIVEILWPHFVPQRAEKAVPWKIFEKGKIEMFVSEKFFLNLDAFCQLWLAEPMGISFYFLTQQKISFV
ncbi:MAG: hypothetical protein ACI353_04750 [Alloprevotella sp.]